MYINFHLACLNFSQPYTLDSRGSPSPTDLAVRPQVHALHDGSIDTHAKGLQVYSGGPGTVKSENKDLVVQSWSLEYFSSRR